MSAREDEVARWPLHPALASVVAALGFSGLGRAERGGAVDRDFDTMQLPESPDVVAPDGSDVRVLLQLARGGMAHFALGGGRVSRAVAHHSVEEIWYIVRGEGQMWRRQAGREETVPLRSGTCVSIPAGTHFQFRCTGGDLLAAVGVTMPPWRGPDEAYQVPGVWPVDSSGTAD
jgi:mannose-6-phosphate isomerase-like protein (cupin superfamily)